MTPTISDVVEDALRAGYRFGTKIRHPGRAHEPDLIAGLITAGVPQLRKALGSALQPLGINTRVGGVFCHGTPKVEQLEGTAKGQRCELGDLLIVTRYQNRNRIIRRSLLLQFKLATSSHGVTVAQSALYAEWPKFRYYNTAKLTGQERKPHPRRAHPGAQIATICPGPARPAWAAPTTATEWGRNKSDLAAEVTDLLFGVGGQGFTLSSSHRYLGWSRMINDLLEVTANRIFSVAGGRVKAPAGEGKNDALSLWLASSKSCVPELGALTPRTLIEVDPRFAATGGNAELDRAEQPPAPLSTQDDHQDDGAISIVFVELDALD